MHCAGQVVVTHQYECDGEVDCGNFLDHPRQADLGHLGSAVGFGHEQSA